MIVIEILIFFIFFILFVLVSLLFVQTMFSMPAWKRNVEPVHERPRVAALIPAHNEEQGIAAIVSNVRLQLRTDDRILVVADNCSDATAEAARIAGAEVCERSNPEQRGKGYALDFGVRYLAVNPPEIVIIIDADCELSEGTIDKLAQAVQLHGQPAQALYLMQVTPNSSPMKKIAALAWMIKNYVRPLGYKRLGLPCHLMGTGMAFSWPIISTAALANGYVVEDLKLGIDLARRGSPAMFCPDAKVISYFPSTDSGEKTQRARWEHGHMHMILITAPGLLMTAIRERKLALLALTLDMCVPPVALLTLLTVALFIVSGLVVFWVDVVWPIQCAGAILIELIASILLSWWRYGREIISFRELLYTPWYMLLKIPLYLGFFIQRQVEWVRTPRDHE